MGNTFHDVRRTPVPSRRSLTRPGRWPAWVMGLLLVLLFGACPVLPVSAWPGEVLYFVLVDRFWDGNPGNNAHVDLNDPRGFHGGDLAGVRAKLDYLQDLGVTGLWLSPLQQNRPGRFYDQQPYHGYWIWDFFAIDERFGTGGELQALAAELKRRDMKLVLDVVVNHAGYDAPLAASFPHLFHQTPNIRDWNDRTERETHRIYGLPDFASEQSIVKAFFLAVARYLVTEFRPDGFRLDAVRHVPLEFWAFFNRLVRQLGGEDFFLLGEQLDGDPSVIAETWTAGKFSSVFDYPLYYTLVEVIARGGSCRNLALRFAADEKYPDPGRIATFLDNHDLDRFFFTCGNDPARYRLALSLLFTARGVPVLYYGDETGMTGGHDSEVANRRSMEFDRDPDILDWTKKMIQLRRGHASLSYGRQEHLGADDTLLAFQRVASSEAAIVLMNTGAESRLVDVRLPEHFPRNARLIDVVTGLSGSVFGGHLRCTLPGLSPAVFFVLPPSPSVFTEYLDRARQCDLDPGLRSQQQVRFEVRGCPASEEQQVFVIGSRPEIGDWKPDRVGPPMTRTGGGTYEITLAIPENAVFEWKCLMKDRTGAVTWHQGENEYVDLTGPGTSRLLTTWK